MALPQGALSHPPLARRLRRHVRPPHLRVDTFYPWVGAPLARLGTGSPPKPVASNRARGLCRLGHDVSWVKAIAVGTQVTPRPPHRSGRARLRHPAPTSGGDGEANDWPRMKDFGSREKVIGQLRDPLPYSASGACFARSRSPWPPPFAPPAPQHRRQTSRPPCSSASQLLLRGLTSRAVGYGSSPSRRGPAALDRAVERELSRFPETRSVCTCQGLRPRRDT